MKGRSISPKTKKQYKFKYGELKFRVYGRWA